MALGRSPLQSKPRQPHSDAMDVDAIHTTPLSPDKKRSLWLRGAVSTARNRGI
jgi:hypothetical protein